MLYLLIFVSSFILALFSTPYAIQHLTKLGVVDYPGKRKIHNKPIPRMGGIIIYLIGVAIFFSYSPKLYSVRIIILTSCILVLCGIFDDVKGLTWRMKFLLQTITVGAMIVFLSGFIKKIELLGITFPEPLGYIILLLFVIGTINSINLMDGMDGLVSGFALIAFIVIFGLAFGDNNTVLLVLTASFAGSTLGFFKYNYYPARIFLGDTGSLTLGFFLVLSCILLSLGSDKGNLDLTFSLILLGVPIVDTLKVMIVRVFKKQNPFLPDRNHLHHVIFGSQVNHKTTVFFIHVFTLLFVFTAVYYIEASEFISIIAFVILSLMLLSVKRLLRLLKDSFIHKSYVYLRDNLPPFMVNFYKRFFVPLAIILLSFLFFLLIPGKSGLGHEVVLFFIIGSIVLFSIFLYQNFRSKLVNDVYVFLNVVVFFSVANLSHPLFSMLHIKYAVAKSVMVITLAIIVLFILLFIMVRERWFGAKVSFLSKFDIALLTAVSLVVILRNYINDPIFYSIAGKLILGFIAYLCYKVITYFNMSLSKVFLYLSFALTLISLIFIYLF